MPGGGTMNLHHLYSLLRKTQDLSGLDEVCSDWSPPRGSTVPVFLVLPSLPCGLSVSPPGRTPPGPQLLLPPCVVFACAACALLASACSECVLAEGLWTQAARAPGSPPPAEDAVIVLALWRCALRAVFLCLGLKPPPP